MKVIVTGGAGFIGSMLVKTIIEETAWDVLTVDKLTYAGSLSTLGKDVMSNPRHQFVELDITDRDNISKVLNDFKPILIMNLAAESHVDNSIEGPIDFINTNILGTFSLLQESYAYWNQRGKPESFRFFQISTDEVFGSLKKDEVSSLEISPYKPNSPYSSSKASADHLVRAWNKTYGLPTLTTFCTNNYGPYQHPEKFIPVIIRSCIQGNDIPIYGKGDNIRSWIYVKDHVDGLLSVVKKGITGETYCIGGNVETSNLNIVRSICTILDEILPRKNSYHDLISFVKDRLGHDYRYSLDDARIKKESGWKPHYTFEKGLKETINWYLKNQSWSEAMMQRAKELKNGNKGYYNGRRSGNKALSHDVGGQ